MLHIYGEFYLNNVKPKYWIILLIPVLIKVPLRECGISEAATMITRHGFTHEPPLPVIKSSRKLKKYKRAMPARLRHSDGQRCWARKYSLDKKMNCEIPIFFGNPYSCFFARTKNNLLYCAKVKKVSYPFVVPTKKQPWASSLRRTRVPHTIGDLWLCFRWWFAANFSNPDISIINQNQANQNNQL